MNRVVELTGAGPEAGERPALKSYGNCLDRDSPFQGELRLEGPPGLNQPTDGTGFAFGTHSRSLEC